MPTKNQLIRHGREEKRRTDRTRASDQCPQKRYKSQLFLYFFVIKNLIEISFEPFVLFFIIILNRFCKLQPFSPIHIFRIDVIKLNPVSITFYKKIYAKCTL